MISRILKSSRHIHSTYSGYVSNYIRPNTSGEKHVYLSNNVCSVNKHTSVLFQVQNLCIPHYSMLLSYMSLFHDVKYTSRTCIRDEWMFTKQNSAFASLYS